MIWLRRRGSIAAVVGEQNLRDAARLLLGFAIVSKRQGREVPQLERRREFEVEIVYRQDIAPSLARSCEHRRCGDFATRAGFRPKSFGQANE